MKSFDIFQADALDWLSGQTSFAGCSMITSLPDISEFSKFSLATYKDWFIDAAALVLSRTPEDGVTIFFQSDIKRDGAWVDKAYLCQKAAERNGSELLAHKIVCRGTPGTVGFGRPAYSHLLCFSKRLRPDTAKSFADVLPEAGETTWTRGMGEKACHLAVKMVKAWTTSHTIVDPFCGHGAVLAIARAEGFSAIGVDRSSKCVKKARALISYV